MRTRAEDPREGSARPPNRWHACPVPAGLVGGRNARRVIVAARPITRIAGFWRSIRLPARRECWLSRSRRCLGRRPGRQYARLDEERSRSLLPVRTHRLLAALRGAVRRRRAARAHFGQLGSDRASVSRRTSRSSTSPPARIRPYEQHLYAMRRRRRRAARGLRRRRAIMHAMLSPDEQLDRRRLLVHQQAAGAVRAGEPRAARQSKKLTISPAPEFWQYPVARCADRASSRRATA